MRTLTCTTCDRDYEYPKGNTLLECSSCYTIARRRALKMRCIDYLGGECQNCGYKRCAWALEFHHRDPSTKVANIAEMLKTLSSWERLQAELDKCDLLCANCHAEAEAGLWILGETPVGRLGIS